MSPAPRPPKTYRASRNRVNRIKLGGNWSIEVWIFIGIVLLALFVMVPWLISHPPREAPAHVIEPR
jgi:hypothetical protein